MALQEGAAEPLEAQTHRTVYFRGAMGLAITGALLHPAKPGAPRR